MNYRHAYHAGNHTEIFKHAALTILLEYLCLKPAPFAMLDTHAGLGMYDLAAEEAVRTDEKSSGIAKLHGRTLKSAPRYSQLLDRFNPGQLDAYPGSPEIALRLLRPSDRLLLCELHPEDIVKLRRRYRKEAQVCVHYRDAYEAISALLPPAERRGLVFIDPPYEKRDEVEHIAKGLRVARKKWASGVYVVWYPIKDASIGDAIARGALSAGFDPILRAEFCPFRRDGLSLAGSGLIICNPPWQLDHMLMDLCVELEPILGTSSCSWSVNVVSASVNPVT